MVPTMVTETRTVKCMECRAEKRQVTYNVCRPVSETKDVSYEIVCPTYEQRTREVKCVVCKPVMSTQECQYTVQVPATETRQGTRKVCKMVPVKQTRTVCEDHGSWQQVTQTYKVGCGDCAQECTRTCNVWVPKIEQKQVEYTCMKPQVEDVAYEYNVTVCHPETRTKTVQVCKMVPEEQVQQVQYTVCVPVKKTVTRPVTTCRMVTEQTTREVTVQVPYPVEKQVQVQVCKMVPKTITCQVPVPCAPCGGCN